jgi:hypothetical protein
MPPLVRSFDIMSHCSFEHNGHDAKDNEQYDQYTYRQ